MTMKRMVMAAIILAISGLPLVGCSNKLAKSTVLEEPKKPEVAPPSAPESIGKGGTGPGMAEQVVRPVQVTPATKERKASLSAEGEAALQDIFFDFDRFAVKDDAKSALNKNAAYMATHKGAGLLIEGHCDERGTTEYNMTLGERRAQAARQYLRYLGVDSSRLDTVSYGTERPFCKEHNEQCWQENRRAHFAVK